MTFFGVLPKRISVCFWGNERRMEKQVARQLSVGINIAQFIVNFLF